MKVAPLYRGQCEGEVIHIQARRWANTVGRPVIQKFAGALQGQRVRKVRLAEIDTPEHGQPWGSQPASVTCFFTSNFLLGPSGSTCGGGQPTGNWSSRQLRMRADSRENSSFGLVSGRHQPHAKA